MPTTVAASSKCHSDTCVAFEDNLRDAAASSKPATAISLEVSNLAFFEEFLTRIDDERGSATVEHIEDRRLQEYVETGKLRKSSCMRKNKDGTTTARTTYSFSTSRTNPPNEGDAAAGINHRRSRFQRFRVRSTAT